MTKFVDPAREAFARGIADERIVAQVLVARDGARFTLRHVADRAATELRLVGMDDLRELAATTASGAFRPLKFAPNLVCGWSVSVANADELGQAMDRIYPGAIPDWYATSTSPVPVTHFREFTGRQTGMYQSAQKLDDPQAALAIRACCDAGSCLKRRYWTVAGLEPDDAGEKGLIPCLEPCAVFLEFARKSARIEQQGPEALTLAPDDLATIRAVLSAALETGLSAEREGDVSDARNPRRIRRVLQLLPE